MIKNILIIDEHRVGDLENHLQLIALLDLVVVVGTTNFKIIKNKFSELPQTVYPIEALDDVIDNIESSIHLKALLAEGCYADMKDTLEDGT